VSIRSTTWFSDPGSFEGVRDRGIAQYIAAHNEDPTPFIWTKTAKRIITKVCRGRVALESVRQLRAT
jgi:hypothetical protein